MEQFLKAVDEITLNDITKIAQKIISSPLTMASYGDGIKFFLSRISLLIDNSRLDWETWFLSFVAVMNVPSYESVNSKFHAKWNCMWSTSSLYFLDHKHAYFKFSRAIYTESAMLKINPREVFVRTWGTIYSGSMFFLIFFYITICLSVLGAWSHD